MGVQLSNSGNVVRSNGKKPEVNNSRWRPLNFDYIQSQLVQKIASTLARAIPMFSRSNCQIRIVVMLYGQTETNRKWTILDV